MAQLLSIEQLASATGMTVRNIREHQTRGLLPPPRLQGRKGSYDEHHVARLRFIQQLQSEGLNLQAIHWLLQRAPADATEEVVRFEQALFAPWGQETPTQWTTQALTQRLGVLSPRLLQRARQLDLIREAGPDEWIVVSPRLLEAGTELLALGIPVEAALDVVEALRDQTAATARTFVRLFATHVWAPFDRDGRPAERWEAVRLALERLRSIATQALVAVFNQSMEATIEQATAAIPMASDGISAQSS